MTEDELIALAVAHNLGRTMKPIGMQTGDVFATDQRYRTQELLDFAAAVAAAERDRLHGRIADLLDVLRMVDDNNRVDAGEVLKSWRGDFVVAEVRRVLGDAK